MGLFVIDMYGIVIGNNVFVRVTFLYVYVCKRDGCGWRDESCISALFKSEVCVNNFFSDCVVVLCSIL